MNEWFKDWFASEEYLKVYSHRNKEDADSLLNLIMSNISISPNSSILDSACGNGRHSESLSKLGFNVFAFDLSKTLLKVAQNNKLDNKYNIKYFCSDIRNIPLNKSFDLILNLFTSFGYFNSDEENFSIVKFARKTLKTKGYFIFDYLNPEYVEKNLIETSEKIIGNKKIIERRKINKNRVEKKIEIVGDEFIHRYFESVQLYSFNEIITKFKHYGFYPVKEFGTYSGDAFNNNNSERMIIIFKKSL